MREFFAVLLAAIVLVGCGGSGSDGGGGGNTNPDFVGRWLGTWQSTGVHGNKVGTSTFDLIKQ